MRNSPGDGTLRQRKDGRWEYRAIVGTDDFGKPIRKSFYSKDKSGAGAKRAYKEYLSKGEDPLSRICTLGQWAPEWLEIYKRDRVGWGTYSEYKIIINKDIVPVIGAVKLEELRPAHIEKLLNENSKYSLSRRKKILFLIRAILDSAVENGYCRKNAAAHAKLERAPEPETEIFSKADVEAILAHDHPFAPAIKIMLLTGMRRGELCALQWFDVDMDAGTITVRHALKRTETGEVIGETKTKKRRVIPISDDLRAVLEGIPKTSEFVITYKGHGPTLAWFRSQYDSFFRGLEVERKTSHKLRHTFASYLVKGEVNLRVVQELLGHTEILTTQRYTHVDVDGLQNAVRKLKF